MINIPPPVVVQGKHLRAGDLVLNWDQATILELTIEPEPSAIVCAKTTKGPYTCGKLARMDVIRMKR